MWRVARSGERASVVWVWPIRDSLVVVRTSFEHQVLRLRSDMDNTFQILRRFVMDAVADDYEDFVMIVHEVQRWATEDELSFAEVDIWNALDRLMKDGVVKAWNLPGSRELPIEVHQVTPEARQTCYFFLTDRGRAALQESAGS
jgi:hypothetical protein